MFILINCYEREISLIGKYDTIDKARIAMHMDVILAMNETNLSADWIDEVRDAVNGQQFNDNFCYEDDEMAILSYGAWANFHEDYYDWKIFEILEDG